MLKMAKDYDLADITVEPNIRETKDKYPYIVLGFGLIYWECADKDTAIEKAKEIANLYDKYLYIC